MKTLKLTLELKSVDCIDGNNAICGPYSNTGNLIRVCSISVILKRGMSVGHYNSYKVYDNKKI